MKRLLLLGLGLFLFFDLLAQNTIRLENPSFEDIRKKGEVPKGWYNCGIEQETPPDVQPGSFDVILPAYDGNTYLGMVVRDNETNEAIGQRLESLLQKDSCYSFSLLMARSDKYMSMSKASMEAANYVTPAILRIWGGYSDCDKAELLAESSIVDHSDWRQYDFNFRPAKKDLSFIMLESYYNTHVLAPYNGNLLVDNCSSINKVSGCAVQKSASSETSASSNITLHTADPKYIFIRNASFEFFPEYARTNPLPASWETIPYPDEILPRTHPEMTETMMVKSDKLGFYTVPILKKPKAEAQDGERYMSLLTRKDGTRQWISQALESNMQKDSAYVFSLFLMHAPHFKEVLLGGNAPADYHAPVKLRVWGGNEVFRKEEVLAESVRVEIGEWKRYVFVLKPQKKDYAYITLEAYYAYAEGKTYDGNIFIDGCSNLVRVSKSSK